MATVWLARDDVLARAVAVKILHPHLADDESFLARFRREALAAARLAHPNIVSIYDTGSEEVPGGDENHYIVMEYCGGGTLGPIVENESPLDPARAVRVGASICEALGYAHRHGIVHRDVKPANVLLTDHHLLKVTDFGIAKAAFGSGDVTTTGKILGTVAYISPEQAAGEEPGPQSDLYALGVILYELLAGRPPFPRTGAVATAIGHLREEPPPPRSIRAGIPRALDAAIMKALEKDPSHRFASAEEMQDALSGGLGGRAPAAPTFRAPQEERDETVVIERQPFLETEGRRIAPVVMLVVGAIAVAILIAALLGTAADDSDEGGPGATTGQNEDSDLGTMGAQAIDFDPEGDGVEHSEDVGAAVDGDPSTSWTTEDYRDPISVQKSGVGLKLDLGGSREVAALEILFDTSGYSFEVLASDSDGSSADDFELIESISAGDQEARVEVDHEARYWVVYITDLPGGAAGTGTISEVTFFGP
jgi:serine/threonine-protein kinase